MRTCTSGKGRQVADPKTVILAGPRQVQTAQEYIADPERAGWVVKISPPTRSLEQNARLWAQLGDIASQVEWYGKRLTPEDWKHVFTASLRKLAVVPNLDGTGFVALGLSTSRMTKRELGDLIDLMTAFGNEHGVRWTEPVAAEPA